MALLKSKSKEIPNIMEVARYREAVEKYRELHREYQERKRNAVNIITDEAEREAALKKNRVESKARRLLGEDIEAAATPSKAAEVQESMKVLESALQIQKLKLERIYNEEIGAIRESAQKAELDAIRKMAAAVEALLASVKHYEDVREALTQSHPVDIDFGRSIGAGFVGFTSSNELESDYESFLSDIRAQTPYKI